MGASQAPDTSSILVFRIMKTDNFYTELKRVISGKQDIVLASYPLNYKNGSYEFLRIASRDISPSDKIFLIRAGIHGEEIAGPLSLLKYLPEIIDKAHAAGLKLIVYPLGNPSGFDRGSRYNIDNDKGDAGNGDFMRYELEDGTMTDDLGQTPHEKVKRWLWSSDPSLQAHLPFETRLMQDVLKKDPLSRVVGALDLHQDYITETDKAAAYHYSFGDLSVYKSIIQNVETIVPIFRTTPIGAGFGVPLLADGSISREVPETALIVSDADGFIIRHDGSLPDLFYHLGTPYCVTVETTGKTPIEKAIEVNRAWMEGFISLCALYNSNNAN